MSGKHIPPFPTGNSADGNYTETFEKARPNRNRSLGSTTPEPVKPKTPSHTHSRPHASRISSGKQPVNPNYPLTHQGKSGNNKSGNKPVNQSNPLHREGSSGTSKSGSSHDGKKSVYPNYPSYPSPNPGRREGSGGGDGREKRNMDEGQYGKYNNTPRRDEPVKNKKKHGGLTPLHDGILPPFPTGTDSGSNYTEMFKRYHEESTSPPPMQPYRPPKTSRCCIL